MPIERLKIIRGPTRAGIEISPYSPYRFTIKHFIKTKLTDYDWVPRFKKYVANRRYITVEEVRDMVYIPINFVAILVIELETEGIPYYFEEEKVVVPKKLTTAMKSSFAPRDHQIEIVKYLKQKEPVRKGLATYTGSGKTVSSIAGAIAYGYVTMIVVSGLTQQWLRSIEQFTDITPDKLYLVQGFKSLIDLINSDLEPDIIVFSLETLRLYVQNEGTYKGILSYPKFLKKFGIGTKIIDEVHLNFHADTILDLKSNIKNNIYLTATFTSTNKSTKKIFDLIYPVNMRFGARTINIYIDAYSYTFCGEVNENRCVSNRGYMHIKYEKQLLKNRLKLNNYFNRILYPLINSHWCNKKRDGEKIIIYFSLVETIDAAYEWLKNIYPEHKVACYVGSTDDAVLVNNDIIITNPKKSGCGTDIKNLRTIINTVSAKSDTQILQLFGRLRELPDGTTPEYIEVYDNNLKSHRRHAREREVLLMSHSRNFIKSHIP